MESESKGILGIDKEKEKKYDSNLIEAKKMLAMIRYEIFSEKRHLISITKN